MHCILKFVYENLVILVRETRSNLKKPCIFLHTPIVGNLVLSGFRPRCASKRRLFVLSRWNLLSSFSRFFSFGIPKNPNHVRGIFFSFFLFFLKRGPRAGTRFPVGSDQKTRKSVYRIFLLVLLMCNRVNLETCKGDRRLGLKGSSVHWRRSESPMRKNEDRLARYVCRLLNKFYLLHKSSS
jgi:hypothetical protein